jgi:Protein of unknown function (DUF3025)
MRFVAPARGQIDPAVFDRPPLSNWREFDGLLRSETWPNIDALNALSSDPSMPRFVEQTRELEADGLHYESRIAELGAIATRQDNWHDLLNALIWLRYPQLKDALNRRQFAEIAVAGPKTRTRAQCALTHFDEAGVIVVLRDRALLRAWDAHDWLDLFWNRREAWLSDQAVAIVFGHALLEHALQPAQLLVGKALAIVDEAKHLNEVRAVDLIADRIRDGRLLRDPQELRPLPLSGIPKWVDANNDEAFYRTAVCFQPLRKGRHYPQAVDDVSLVREIEDV